MPLIIIKQVFCLHLVVQTSLTWLLVLAGAFRLLEVQPTLEALQVHYFSVLLSEKHTAVFLWWADHYLAAELLILDTPGYSGNMNHGPSLFTFTQSEVAHRMKICTSIIFQLPCFFFVYSTCSAFYSACCKSSAQSIECNYSNGMGRARLGPFLLHSI